MDYIPGFKETVQKDLIIQFYRKSVLNSLWFFMVFTHSGLESKLYFTSTILRW